MRVRFSIDVAERKSLVDYCVELSRNEESFKVAKESLSLTKWNGEKFLKKKLLLGYEEKM